MIHTKDILQKSQYHVYLLKKQGNRISVSKVDYILADPNDREKFVVRNASYVGSSGEVAHGINHVYLLNTQEIVFLFHWLIMSLQIPMI